MALKHTNPTKPRWDKKERIANFFGLSHAVPGMKQTDHLAGRRITGLGFSSLKFVASVTGGCQICYVVVSPQRQRNNMVNNRRHPDQAMRSLAILAPVARLRDDLLTYFAGNGHLYGSSNSSRGEMRCPRQRSTAQAYAFRTMSRSADKRKSASSSCSARVRFPSWFFSSRATWRFCCSGATCAWAVASNWSTGHCCMANKSACISGGASSTDGGKLPTTLWATNFSTD